MQITGIYTITCITTHKIYVGFATNIKNRFRYHKDRLKLNIHDNSYLQNAYNVYGVDNFLFEVLEECDKKFLASQENYWCNILNTHNRNYGFNIQRTHPDGRFVNPRESIERQRLKLLGRKNKPHSEETKEKIRRGNLGRIVSEETRYKQKIAQSNRKRKSKPKKETRKPYKLLQLDSERNLIKEWKKCSDVKNTLNLDISNIAKCCKGLKGLTYGYFWEYKK